MVPRQGEIDRIIEMLFVPQGHDFLGAPADVSTIVGLAAFQASSGDAQVALRISDRALIAALSMGLLRWCGTL